MVPLVSMRLFLALLLEGVIFWLFRFRQKEVGLYFLPSTLFQGALNNWLNSGGSLKPSYLIVNLIIGEVFVFAAEMIAFPIFINEHKKRRISIYVISSNLISLIAGEHIITLLPV